MFDRCRDCATEVIESRLWVHFMLIWIIRASITFLSNRLHMESVLLSPTRFCTLNLAILAHESFLATPSIPQCRLCMPRFNYIVLNSGAHNQSAQTVAAGRDIGFTGANIVRTNYDRSGLFALALTLYYESNVVGLFDFREFRDDARVREWMEVAIRKVINRENDIIFSDKGGAIMSSSVARHLLMYTDIKYSNDQVLSVLMRLCTCELSSKWNAAIVTMSTLQDVPLQKTRLCPKVPTDFQCERYDVGNEDYALMVPAYKRNYMELSIRGAMSQTVKPKQIFILQNRMHTIFDFNFLANISTVPIWHFWATNWNTYFFLTYVVMMFIEQKYALKMDDDSFPNSVTSFEQLLKHVRARKNTIVGILGYTAPEGETFNCDIKGREFQRPMANDHVAQVVMMPAAAGKILHRFRAYTYLGGEDIAVSVTNSMECGTKSYWEQVPFWDHHSDGNTSQANDEVSREVDKLNVGWIFLPIYCHYIRAGYNPQCWKSAQRPHKTDIRYPH